MIGKCQGCDERKQVDPYRVTFHNRTTERVDYCIGCAELARVDWSGEIASLEGPLPRWFEMWRERDGDWVIWLLSSPGGNKIECVHRGSRVSCRAWLQQENERCL